MPIANEKYPFRVKHRFEQNTNADSSNNHRRHFVDALRAKSCIECGVSIGIKALRAMPENANSSSLNKECNFLLRQEINDNRNMGTDT